MLVELSIRDLALIEAAELPFGPGLNVITGETGAGKSLVVGALELLVGQRHKAGAKVVRTGADAARVEGRFELVAGSERARLVRAFLEQELPELVEAFDETASVLQAGEALDVHELILGRTITKEGRSRAHVGHRPASLKALAGVAAILFEIHGQNDHQRLLQRDEQLALLDGFAGCAKELAAYREARAAWRQVSAELERFEAERAERRDRLDLVRFQLGELEEAGLEVGERERLSAERERLSHAEALSTELGGVAMGLSEGDEPLLDTLRAMERRVEAWHRRLGEGAGLEAALSNLREAVVYTEEGAAALVSFTSDLEIDPGRLEEVEERLDELERLMDKYDQDEAGLVALGATLREELDGLEVSEGSGEALVQKVAAVREVLERRAAALTKQRKACAKPLAKAVEAALKGLGLGKARFGVTFVAEGAGKGDAALFGSRGVETVEFQLAANPGEAPAPLAMVASGGEAARIMLALESVLSQNETGRCLVFDEVDTGVGGRLGPEVAARLRELGESHQVLCVTHLPAIAAGAHRHLRVAKEERAGRTLTVFAELAGEPRVRELADMIAGGADEATAKAEASRLLAAFG